MTSALSASVGERRGQFPPVGSSASGRCAQKTTIQGQCHFGVLKLAARYKSETHIKSVMAPHSFLALLRKNNKSSGPLAVSYISGGQLSHLPQSHFDAKAGSGSTTDCCVCPPHCNEHSALHSQYPTPGFSAPPSLPPSEIGLILPTSASNPLISRPRLLSILFFHTACSPSCSFPQVVSLCQPYHTLASGHV